jgi:NAD(P)-dependent dehydrogenase (short-subunit alcohol dehydrogenase family)
MEWFAGKSAVVTGAAHGIGRGIAELLDQLGANVLAVDRDDRALNATFAASDITPWTADLAGDTPALAQEITSSHGPVDLLVNNVGIETADRFLDLDERAFDLVFNANLRGPWFLTRQLARAMVAEDRPGAIVFVSSLHDSFVRGYPHYSASKAAIAMLVKELARELGPHGIRVNAVSPGAIASRHLPGDDAAALQVSHSLVPLGRQGTPPDVARIVAVLLSDEWAGYVTGANVRVDGGLGVYSWSV